ncbi:hypothetical protein EHS25_005993 [Saitozyma podzolica]|uniref:Pyridoxine biosynthesis protein n=1 Tax=Saitozyma podzolica TaxID=1890683 RepID=A0A427XTX7_9TREE|nr:hypothetical protein EHS25_005993 [Saitozyma podzolica]
MSPTMTEGGVASWKKSEGESFAAGDVLLEVETDKATIDVEAQDDGVLGKIIVQAGSSKIPVGQIIAVLAEEGDDLSSIEIPKDDAPPAKAQAGEQSKPSEKPAQEGKKEPASATPAAQPKKEHGHKEIKHSKAIFPSVYRLLQESDLSTSQISKLKGTGKDGMLTKGDVLVALGKLKNPFGSAEKLNTDILGPSGKRASESAATTPSKSAEKEVPLDAPSLRRLIIQGMAKASEPARPIVSHDATSLPLSSDYEFDAILAPYASLLPPPKPAVGIPGREALAAMESKGVGAKQDEWAGLF